MMRIILSAPAPMSLKNGRTPDIVPPQHFAWHARLRAALVHLALSAMVAAVAAVVVFVLWYPMPFREISGGRELFTLVVAVDTVIGPLITLAVFDHRKPRSELVRDLGVVVALQLTALAYGMYSVAEARPAVVALEGNRLRVVRAIDLDSDSLAAAPAELRALSWSGPRLVATRAPATDEKFEAIQLGLAGEDIGMRPSFWLPAARTASAFAAAAQPIDDLMRRHPARAADLRAAISRAGRPAEQLGFLPILARRTDWSALIDRRSGEVAGYVALEGF